MILSVGPVPTELDFTAPHIEYGQIYPLLIVLGLAVVGVLIEAFAPAGFAIRRRWR